MVNRICIKSNSRLTLAGLDCCWFGYGARSSAGEGTTGSSLFAQFDWAARCRTNVDGCVINVGLVGIVGWKVLLQVVMFAYLFIVFV